MCMNTPSVLEIPILSYMSVSDRMGLRVQVAKKLLRNTRSSRVHGLQSCTLSRSTSISSNVEVCSTINKYSPTRP